MFIGIDPDLHDLALGFWNNGAPAGAHVVHVVRRKGRVGQEAVMDMVKAMWALPTHYPKDPQGIAIEAQTLMRSGRKQHKRPQDIVVLGNVAGAALGICSHHTPIHLIKFPTPEAWKGQIPKSVMQARLYSDLGWGYEMIGKDPETGKADYARPLRTPDSFHHITEGQWKHVGDALLLARWASENIR